MVGGYVFLKSAGVPSPISGYRDTILNRICKHRIYSQTGRLLKNELASQNIA